MEAGNLFPLIDVSKWEWSGFEAIGDDEKVWLIEPLSHDAWLYKPVSHKSQTINGLRNDWFQGEDWSEKIASELGRLIGLPCAQIELALRGGDRGCISRDVRPDGWEMQPGSVLLSGTVSDYRPGWENVPGRPGHSIHNIKSTLEGFAAPLGWPALESCDAFDVFAGYLVLDAWIANRDRHDENWAVLREIAGTRPPSLAPSFDHASSLGFNLLDSKRARILDGHVLEAWAARGTAWRFEHAPGAVPTLVDVTTSALDLVSDRIRSRWLGCLEASTADQVAELVHRVSGLSEASRTFIVELTSLNRRRLLDGCS